MLSGEQMVTRPVSGEMCDTYTEVHTSLMRLDTFKTMDSATETVRNMATSASEEFEKLYKVGEEKYTTFYEVDVTLQKLRFCFNVYFELKWLYGSPRTISFKFNSWFSFCINDTFTSRLVQFSEKAASGSFMLGCAVEMDSKSRSSTLLRRR